MKGFFFNMKKKYYYLIHIQYLGFRFHGWAKQPQVKTVHYMIDKTLSYVLEHNDFKTLGGSRTDAMVSTTDFVLELFVHQPLVPDSFLSDFNLNLPSDIRALSIEETDKQFNIIQNPKEKRYIYLFAHGEKAHPFSAPFLTTIQSELDIDNMKAGAKLFEGEHEFKAYCKKPNENTQTRRSINKCELVENIFYSASFFPSDSYALVFVGKGFLRNQIRMIMAQLFRLGKGEIDIEFLKSSLKEGFTQHLSEVARNKASGLILEKVSLN